MRKLGRTAAVLLVAATLADSARAQDPKKPVTFTGDLGFVNTAGNTHLTTINIGDRLTATAGKLLLTQTFALVYGRSEGKQNANSQLLRARADYSLAARVAVYGFAGYERNRFAGIAHRIDEGIGLAAAVDLTVGDNFVSGRLAARFKHLFSKVAYFQQALEFLPNLETTRDYRINSESALVAPISRHFGLKAAYLIRYNHAPPSPALARTDRLLTSGVQVTY